MAEAENENTEEVPGVQENEPGEVSESVESGESLEETKGKKRRRISRQDKKLIRRRTSKKETSSLATALRLAVETGKVEFGTRRAFRQSLLHKPKILVLARNTPQETRESIHRYSALSGIPILEFEGSSLELGSVCGKPFPIAVLTVEETGSSNLLDFAKVTKSNSQNK